MTSYRNISMPILWIFNVIIFGLMLFPNFTMALPAFPGATGFGSETIGGRGGQIIEVTNLNDSGTGSLRDALTASGPRIVIFRTGGTIKLDSNVVVRQPYLTIAGQTAPGDGITIRGAGITVVTHDVIVRGIRIRVGDDPNGPAPSNRDALQVEDGAYNVIIDHCSFSWSIDELVTFYSSDTHDITLSNSIMSEPLNNSIHPDGAHPMGVLAGPGTNNISYIGNLLVHIGERNPKVRAVNAMVVNNVIYDRQWKDIDIQTAGTSEPQKISVVGNYFIKGNSYLGNRSIYIRDGLEVGTEIYVHDNDCSSYGWSDCVQNLNSSFDPLVNTAPIWWPDLVAKSSTDIVDWVLDTAGATPRDPVDLRIIDHVREADNGNIIGGLIDSQDDVGGWPVLNTGTLPVDSDHDGMPDDWEIANGLDPQDIDDGNQDKDNDGYSNIEEYINSLMTIAAKNPPNAPGNLEAF